MDRRRTIKAAATLCAAAFCTHGLSQSQPKVWRIGFLSPLKQTYQGAFFESLRELGYVEGRNIVIERRFAEGDDQRLAALAADLVQLRVDAIVVTNSTATAAALKATQSIPLVMVTGGDPVEAKFVSSLAHPGGNVTGTTSLSSDVGLKLLQVLREAFPQVKRVAVLADEENPGQRRFLEEVKSAASRLGITTELIALRQPQDLTPALEAVLRARPEALLVPAHPLTIARRKEIIAFVNKNRLPAIYTLKEFVQDGGVISFGTSFSALYRRAAVYLDKILKGTRPSELPIEQPSKFDLVINLKAAKAEGITLPKDLLLRADEVIE